MTLVSIFPHPLSFRRTRRIATRLYLSLGAPLLSRYTIRRTNNTFIGVSAQKKAIPKFNNKYRVDFSGRSSSYIRNYRSLPKLGNNPICTVTDNQCLGRIDSRRRKKKGAAAQMRRNSSRNPVKRFGFCDLLGPFPNSEGNLPCGRSPISFVTDWMNIKWPGTVSSLAQALSSTIFAEIANSFFLCVVYFYIKSPGFLFGLLISHIQWPLIKETPQIGILMLTIDAANSGASSERTENYWVQAGVFKFVNCIIIIIHRI